MINIFSFLGLLFSQYYLVIPSSNESNLIYILTKRQEGGGRGGGIQDFIVLESSQYICCKFSFVQWFYQCLRMYHKMVILFHNLSMLPPAAVIENCLETPVPKPWQMKVSFICSIGIFSDRETLELLAVSCLTFTWFCFICGTVVFVFISDFRKCCRLPELLGECYPVFPCMDCHICLSIFKWNCST